MAETVIVWLLAPAITFTLAVEVRALNTWLLVFIAVTLIVSEESPPVSVVFPVPRLMLILLSIVLLPVAIVSGPVAVPRLPEIDKLSIP